jgi:hypothetical protein
MKYYSTNFYAIYFSINSKPMSHNRSFSVINLLGRADLCGHAPASRDKRRGRGRRRRGAGAGEGGEPPLSCRAGAAAVLRGGGTGGGEQREPQTAAWGNWGRGTPGAADGGGGKLGRRRPGAASFLPCRRGCGFRAGLSRAGPSCGGGRDGGGELGRRTAGAASSLPCSRGE